jgi:hypothetical protein
MIRDVLAVEPAVVENPKIRLIHKMTGSQYWRNRDIDGRYHR